MRVRLFKEHVANSLAQSVVSPEMMAILLIALYVVHWFIHPEALEYLGQTLKGCAGSIDQGLSRYSNYELFACLSADKRLIYMAVEVTTGLLQSILATALLVALCIYIYKRTQSDYYMSIAGIPVIGLLASALQISVFAILIMSYPTRAETQALMAVGLRVATLGVYSAAALLLLSGIIRDFPALRQQR